MNKKYLAQIALILFCGRVLAAGITQQLPHIFDQTPKQILPAKTLAEFPANTFLENIAINRAGELFINSYLEGKVYRVNLRGEKSEFANVNGRIAGIAFDSRGNLLISGVDNEGAGAIFRVTPAGAAERWVSMKDAMFLNGVTHLTGDKFLVADSYKGAIWEVDAQARSARVWLAHSLLARSEASNPYPAVNGLKFFGQTLYASNTQRQLLLQIPITSAGQPGEPSIVLEHINLDDFAFDQKGNLYGTTHVYNNLVRIGMDKKITILAELAQGMAGNTAVAFGRTASDRQSIYVTTNGGMSLPPPTGIQPAKVVRIEVGAAGLPLR